MKINRTEFYRLYMERINHIADVCDWKTHFTPKEIVELISTILERNPELIDLTDRSDRCPNCGRILQCYDLCGYEPCNCKQDDIEE